MTKADGKTKISPICNSANSLYTFTTYCDDFNLTSQSRVSAKPKAVNPKGRDNGPPPLTTEYRAVSSNKELGMKPQAPMHFRHSAHFSSDSIS